MERLNAIFEDEVKKRVAEETKRIKEEYKDLLKKAKEEFKEQLKKIQIESKEELCKHKAEVHQAKDDFKKGLKKNKDEYNEEIRKYQDDYRERLRNYHTEYSVYLKQVSVNYGIPYNMLIRDAPDDKDVMCKGIRPNGTRCSMKGKHDGYCSFHKAQIPRSNVVEMVNEPIVMPPQKGLIDFSTMM